MKTKQKKCKGSGQAKGYGCNSIDFAFKYGLCKGCFAKWLYNTESGKIYLDKITIKAKVTIKTNSKIKRKYIKWVDKEFQEMKKYVQSEICNSYIRVRDTENYNECISSKNQIHDAGHFFAVGSCEQLRFSPQNIHGQNRSDNGFKGGNLINYEIGLINRHGDKYLKSLKKLKVESHRWHKLDKSELIKIGKTYEYLTKQKIWCYTQKEFDNYKDIINK